MRMTDTKLAQRILAGASAVALLATIGATGVLAEGPPGLAFYVDGERYRTVGTPTDLNGTGAPEFTYDAIYALGDGLINVAEAKPGDTDYNGGRWQVLPVTWAAGVTPVQYTSAEQVLAAADAGLLTIGASVKWFVCPVIAVPRSWGA